MIGNKQLREYAIWTEGLQEEICIPAQPGLPDEHLKKQGCVTMPEWFVANVTGAMIAGSIGAVHFANDVALEPAYCGRIDVLLRNSSYISDVSASFQYEPFDYHSLFPLIGVWSNEFFHWVTEFFPKLQAYSIFKGSPLIALHADPPGFVTDMLDLCGFGYRTRKIHPLFRANVIIPTTRRWQGYTSQRAIVWVVNKMTENIPPVDGGPTHFYISRADNVKARRVVNEDDIIPILQEAGFYVIDPGTFSVAEQVALFQNAKAIIGPHGGGMTNLIYGDSPFVYEFFPPSYINPCIYTLAKSQFCEYDCVVCEPHGAEDIIIDPEQLRKALERIQNHEPQ